MRQSQERRPSIVDRGAGERRNSLTLAKRQELEKWAAASGNSDQLGEEHEVVDSKVIWHQVVSVYSPED